MSDLNGDGFIDAVDTDGDGCSTPSQQAAGYRASDPSFIEPPGAAGSTDLISDHQDPGL